MSLACCCCVPVPAGNYIDHKCPFTGNISIRGRILAGKVRSGRCGAGLQLRMCSSCCMTSIGWACCQPAAPAAPAASCLPGCLPAERSSGMQRRTPKQGDSWRGACAAAAAASDAAGGAKSRGRRPAAAATRSSSRTADVGRHLWHSSAAAGRLRRAGGPAADTGSSEQPLAALSFRAPDSHIFSLPPLPARLPPRRCGAPR